MRRSGRRRVSGFTLIELAVALAILGLVTSTVYLALGGALRSAERIREAQEPYQRGRVARAFLSTALRSAAPFAGLPGDGFMAVDSARSGGVPIDELTFVSLAPPTSGGMRMQVHLFVRDSSGTPTLLLEVRNLSTTADSLPPYRRHVLSTGVAGLDIEYLMGPSTRHVTWQKDWDASIRLPHAVRIWFLPATSPDPLYRVPLVVQIPTGRML